MNLKIKYYLYRQKLKLAPEAKFKRDLWKNLADAWDAKYKVNYSWYQTPVFRWVTAGVVGVVLAGSFGTGAYAYVSPEVTEGTALYLLKQGLEKVEEIIKVTPEAKAKFLLRKIERREAEKAVLERRQQKIERVEERIKIIENKLLETENLLEKVEVKDNNLKPRVREVLRKVQEKRGRNLEKRAEKMEEKIEKLEDKKEILNFKSENSVLTPDSNRGEGRNGIKGNSKKFAN